MQADPSCNRPIENGGDKHWEENQLDAIKEKEDEKKRDRWMVNDGIGAGEEYANKSNSLDDDDYKETDEMRRPED